MGIEASPVTRGRAPSPATGCSPTAKASREISAGKPPPVIGIRGAERAAERAPQELQRAGGLPPALVRGCPGQGEIGITQDGVVAEALDPPARAVRRQRRRRAERPCERPAKRLGVGVRGQDAERGLPLLAGGELRRQSLGAAPHSSGAFVPAEALPEDVAHDHAPLALDAERDEVGTDGCREVPEEERGRCRRLQEARVEHRLAARGWKPVEGRLHARRQRLLLDEPDAIGRGETTAQHARDRQEARRLRAHQRLEALPVEA